jgi:hypothetical protein
MAVMPTRALDRKTGFQPVSADSASSLSANEPPGWKPAGQDTRDTRPHAERDIYQKQEVTS